MSSLERPLILHSPSSRINNELPQSSIFRRPPRLFKPAQRWACRPCGLILGTCHLLLGIFLLIFDVATNYISETAFAITACICFINSGIIGLIAARRFDKGTITLFLIFSILSAGLCLVLIVECISVINFLCNVHRECYGNEYAVRSALLVTVMLELATCSVSCIVSVRSLCTRIENADVFVAKSPYHLLIYGDLVPPIGIRRVVQVDDGPLSPGSNSRLLHEYLLQDE